MPSTWPRTPASCCCAPRGRPTRRPIGRSSEVPDRPTAWRRPAPSPREPTMATSPYGGPLISLDEAIDLHCHPYPDLFPRLADDIDIALAARDAGMRALVLKCHHESTVSRAYLVQRVVPGIRVFGGVVLNSYVGGINPAAVEAALRLGGMDADRRRRLPRAGPRRHRRLRPAAGRPATGRRHLGRRRRRQAQAPGQGRPRPRRRASGDPRHLPSVTG